MKQFYQIVAEGTVCGSGFVKITSQEIYDSPKKAKAEMETFKTVVAIDDIKKTYVRILYLKGS